jgi:hypothetical protein
VTRVELCVPRRAVALALAATLLFAAPALAAPPPNDVPAAAAPFVTFTAADGRPQDLEATAEPGEATPDAGVPRCLGPTSFERTVWYRIPAGPAQRLLRVEGFGRTLDLVDLAAFVQPAGAPAPATAVPNACAGSGAGGADAGEEPTSGIALRVPAGRDVLIQAGRRGVARAPADEEALLSLDSTDLAATLPPLGDTARPGTPVARSSRATFIALKGATITEEDPALPNCPALGTVWRRFVAGSSGLRRFSVTGASASTLAVFRGRLPTAANALDCVNRSGFGSLQMRVRAKRGQPLWIRIGTSNSTGSLGALLRLLDGSVPVVDGGPGGFDPTPGGAGGGLPDACDGAAAERARISGPRLRGRVKRDQHRRVLPVAIRVRGSSACDATLTLLGPDDEVYARAHAIRLHGRQVVRLAIVRPLERGRYHLRVTARSERGGHAEVRTSVRGRWR